ncbi:MAG: helix-turn-helix transcriptional regulator [Smithella sp.]
MSVETLFKSMSWNKKLEMLRTAKGWSQEEAADRCGTTKKNYWLWETGKNYPRNVSRRYIGMAFEVSQEEIFD